MLPVKNIVAGVFCATVLGFIWFGVPKADTQYTNAEGISPILESEMKVQPKYALHILFIGNSFTFYHDIPHELVDIATSDPGSQTQFFVQSVTRGGASLHDMWEDSRTQQVLQANHWDYVVLQQHSSWAINSVESTYNSVTRFDKEIRHQGGKTLIYLTWPDRPGSHWYADRGMYGDAETVLNKFILETNKLTHSIGAQSVDVGYYWVRMLQEQPDIELYENDQHHPNNNGSFLSALVFYKTLTGRDINAVDYRPDAVSRDAARKIKAIVAQSPPSQ